MRIRQQLSLSLLSTTAAIAATACTPPEPDEDEAAPARATAVSHSLADLETMKPGVAEAIAERRRAAARAAALAPASKAKEPGNISIASTATMMTSLDVDAFNPVFVSYTGATNALGAPTAAADRAAYGRILPIKGDSFLLMSTGLASEDSAFAEPGTDHPPLNSTTGDATTFIFRVTVPVGLNRMSFDFNFLSAESPDFINAGFNDTFTAFVTDAQGRRQIATATVDTAIFHPVSAVNNGNNPYLLYSDIPAGVDNFVVGQVGSDVDAGVTDFQHVDVPVAAGQVTIELEIHDVLDGILDSAVIIDNMAFSAVETLDPRDGLIDENGRVKRPGPIEVATGGRAINGVVADGVTQVLLRAKVPTAGTATFSVQGGAASDGQVSPNRNSSDTNPLPWGPTAENIASVLTNNQHFVYALYRAPADFARPGVDADLTAKKRDATLVMTFTPTNGTAGTPQQIPMTIVRPPVVVLPDLWSDCFEWAGSPGSIMSSDTPPEEQPFNISCVSYDKTIQHGLVANGEAVPSGITNALDGLRAIGLAGTQVDIIGHGIGGLLARRYIQAVSFLRFDNFYEGSINRLLMLQTPNLGMRLADELVKVRAFAKTRIVSGDFAWNLISGVIEAPGSNIFIDDDDCTDVDGEIQCNRIADDLKADSLPINEIGQNVTAARKVAYHAFIRTGGSAVPRSTAITGQLPSKHKALFVQMENNHHLTWNQPVTVKQRLIFDGPTAGVQTFVFCSDPTRTPDDDHDFITTTHEQRGGIVDEGALTIRPILGPLDNHFKILQNADNTLRMSVLLNSPTGGSLFTNNVPSPSAVPRINNCPLSDPPAMLASAPPRALAQRTVTITSPPAGTVVTPGQSIAVTVATSGDGDPESIILVGAGTSLVVESPPPYVVDFPIPAGALGATTLKAYAFYELGDIAVSAPIPLTVSSTAQLVSIDVLGGNAVLSRPGATRQLTVIGRFSDGILRDLTAASTGTLYTRSSLTQSATVSAEGLVTGTNPGDATIIVRNSGKITSINVRVNDPCGNGTVDPGETCDDGDRDSGDGCSATCQIENSPPVAVCSSPTVCNDPGVCSANVTGLGDGSTDPDDDALTFAQSPAGPYAVGQHAVEVSVFDGFFTRTCTSAVDVNDCEAPSLSCPDSFAVECTGAGGADVTPPGATASDNCNDATVSGPAAGRRALGTHALDYSAVDGAGNPATCTSQVTVRDTTAPALSCPPTTVAECSGGGAATVTPAAGSATDVCTTATVSGPGTGSYPLGATPISYTATDLSGNQSTCLSSVLVQDTVAPTLTCPAPTVAECTGAGHAVVDPGDAVGTDSCAPVAVTDPGASAFPLGTTTVNYTATDAGGNQTACATTVTVQDTTPPEGFSDGAPPLSPPDHEYRTVHLSDCNISVIDACGGPLPPSIHQAQINCVTSDEPDDVPGSIDGNTRHDIVVVDGQTVKLRAEQHGGRDGRLYNIYFKIEDAQGNRINGVCPVEVRAAGCAPDDPSCAPGDSGGKHSVCL